MGQLLALLELILPKALATVGAAVESGQDAATPTKPVDAAQLMQRHQKLKPDLDKMIAKGGALATGLRGQLDEFRKAVAAKKLEQAATLLGRLEEVVWMDTGKAPPTSGGAVKGSADPDEQAVDAQFQTVQDFIDAIPEQADKQQLGGELDALMESRGAALDETDAKKKSAKLKALLPKAKKLADKAAALGLADQARRDVAAAKAEVDALMTQITALVLGGISAPGPRDKINVELKKLAAVVDKAAKTKDAKPALAAYNAVKPAARDLLGKAQAAAGAPQWAEGQLKPLLDAVKAAIAGIAAPAPKGVLGKEVGAIEADIARFQSADDVASLQKLVAPRLQKLHHFATALGAASARADAELQRAASMVGGFDATRSAEIRNRLALLQSHKQSVWPIGASVEEMDKSIATFEASLRSFIADAEVLKLKLDALKDIAALRKRVDELTPRTDKASETPVPKFIEKAQKDVRDSLAATIAELDKEDLKKAEAAFGKLVAALDVMETWKHALEDFRQKLDAADKGEIKAALDLKLEPAALKKTCTTAIGKERKEIVALAEAGYPTNAGKRIPGWIVGAKAWAGAKAAYDNMHSGKPSSDLLTKLANAPGGGPVLDALVADLPDNIDQDVLTEAVKARYGIVVKQYDHRDNAKTGATKTAANPKSPDKALKGLYQVLGKVPLKDTKNVKNIERYTEESGGASYRNGAGLVKLYCGRPDDGNVQEFNKPGEVVPVGEKVDKGCEPVNPKAKEPYFNFATLHEVGHAVDDVKGIMKGGRNRDAGWKDHTASDIAGIAADHFKYDRAYLEVVTASKKGTPPAVKPAPPSGTKPEDWDLARQKAEDWIKSIREDAGIWWRGGECKRTALGGRVYHEAYADWGSWVSYNLSARSQGVTGYQFRSPMEWFAELYATFYSQKMNPKHPAAAWLAKLKAEKT
ncbi:MAG: hypothetical protein ACXWCN_02350 [Caldimonas sp.]